MRLEPIIKEKAKERQIEAGKTYGVGSNEKVVQKSAQAIKNKSRDELAKIAGVSHDTNGKHILSKNKYADSFKKCNILFKIYSKSVESMNQVIFSEVDN